MTNFKDFEVVLKAANRDLEALKEMNKVVQVKLDNIAEDKYTKLHNYFSDLYQFGKRNGIQMNKLYIHTPIYSEMYHHYYVIRIAENQNGIDIAMHVTRDFKTYEWLRWVTLTPKLMVNDGNPLPGKELLQYFANNFEEVEPIVSNNFKEAIIKYMANELKETEEALRKKLNDLESE